MATGLQESLNAPDFQRFRELSRQLQDGTRKKWSQPTSSPEFDDEEALKRFNALMDSDFFKDHTDGSII